MKKFLTTIIVIIIAVSLGFGVFYLVKDNEVISLKTASLYKNVNENFSVGLDLEDPNSYTKYEVYSTNEDVVKVVSDKVEIAGNTATGEFTAVSGGVAKIVFKTNNAKFRNVTCDVIVCDGSMAYPFRISTAEDLAKIGNDSLYTLDKCYELTNNIDLGTITDIANGEIWEPLGEFKGLFNGKGYTIENLVIGGTVSYAGLFSTISSVAKVENVRFSDVVINATGSANQFVGTVAGVNHGAIERIEVKNVTIDSSNSNAIIGGVVGNNQSTKVATSKIIATVNRASAVLATGENVQGTIGGVAGKNHGGKIYFAYARGLADIATGSIAGGITAVNEVLENEIGASVQECYSTISFNEITGRTVGAIIGKTIDSTSVKQNVVAGTYYVGEDLKGVSNLTDENYKSTKVDEATLKDVSKLISASVSTSKIVIDGGVYKIEVDESVQPVLYYWNTGVWYTKSGENDGYLMISFDDQDVLPAISAKNEEVKKISSATELRDSLLNNLGGTFLIDGEIDFSVIDWTPIGTEETPFTGSIYGINNAVIKNLTVTNTDGYAGLFGYVKSAIIDGLSFQNANITGKYAGVVAGYNNGQIQNFSITNSVVTATLGGGAVAGKNDGIIYGYSNANSLNDVTKAGLVLSTQVVGNASASIGGVAGVNHGSIIGHNSRIIVEDVTVKSASDNNKKMGGVVGENYGAIGKVNVGSSTKKVTISNDGKSGNYIAGGVTGYTSGNISQVAVTVSIDAGVNKGTYVGGVAGQVQFNSKGNSIKSSTVEGSSLKGYKVGGVVATLNTSYNVDIEISVNYLKYLGSDITTVDNLDSLIENPEIKGVSVISTKTYGNYTAGAICELTKGVATDIYIDVELRGSENAGIVYQIGYVPNGNKGGQGGLVNNVVSIATGKAGKSYATSKNEIHKQPLASKRNCGFVVNYHYLTDKGLQNQTHNGIPFINPHMGLNEKGMKKASNWSFLGTSNWDVKEGDIPTLLV